MIEEEIDTLLANFKIGASMAVPFHVSIYEETSSKSSVLTRVSEQLFELVTNFTAVWEGHNSNMNNSTSENRSIYQIRENFRSSNLYPEDILLFV